MSDKEEPDSISTKFSLLDIPGLEYEVVEESLDPKPGPSRQDLNVSVVPSGSGLRFLVDPLSVDDEDEDDGELLETSDAYAVKPTLEDDEGDQNPSRVKLRENDGNGEDCDVAQIRRQQKLTDKYIEGKLSFRELVRELNQDSEEEDYSEGSDDVSDDGDEEWTPSKKARASLETPKKSAGDDDDDHQAKFEAELDQTRRQQLSKRKKKVGASQRRKRLDPALQGLMGEANLRYARGDRETAIKMCMEIIRQDPAAPEPFQTLSTLYEESGDQEKSLQFAMLAAHLAPQDPEEWARLADMSLEMENMQQAAACYKKAIDADIENIRYHHARCGLLEEMGDTRAALRGLRRLMPEQASEYLHAAREVARLLHEKEDLIGAKDALAEAVAKHSDHVSSEDVNLLLELLLNLNMSDDALDTLCKYCGVKFFSGQEGMTREDAEAMPPEKQLQMFAEVVCPEVTPVDIKSKLVIVLVNLGAVHLVKEISEEILTFHVESYGDLMLEVAESFMSGGFFKEALPFLEVLVQSQSYSEAEVWLKFGECLLANGQLEQSEHAFKNVVDLAPNHMDARRTLSGILHKLGRPEEALHTLTQNEEAELLNPTLLYERCQLLLSEGCEEEFIVKAKLLLSRHFVNIRNRDELHAVASTKKLSSKNKALLEVRSYMREPIADLGGPNFEQASQISVTDEFKLFRRLCNLLFQRKRYGELQRATFSAMGSPHFNKEPELVKECEFLCLLSSFLNGDSYHAYNLVRELVVKFVRNSRVWNLLNLVIMRADDVRHNRFLMRLMSRHPDNVALGILNGHNCLVAGTYKYSLGEYMSAFKQEPQNPMIALMLGLTFTHMACQKFSAKKHSLVVQACAFLNQYLKLRGPCQESCYNLGRAMHQLGLLPAALHYYKQALETKPVIEGDYNMDLSREIAYNMALIYQGSGSPELARMYLQKHIVI